MLRQNFRTAFTLVELMVVIVIVGILSAIAVTGYGMYVKKARIAEAYTGLDNLTKAEITHFLQTKGFDAYISTNNVTAMNNVYGSQGYYVIENVPTNGTINPPFPIGSKARWWFQAVAYKADGNGNMLGSLSPQGIYYTTGVNMSMWGRNGWCTNKTGQSMAPPNRPHYQQSVVRAFTDFQLEDENYCSGLERKIHLDENGKVGSGPFISMRWEGRV